MRLRWTVVDAAGRRPREAAVVVSCPQGTSLSEVLASLPRSTAGRPGGTGDDVRVGGRPVTGPAVVGLPPLLDGAVLTVGAGRPPRRAAALLELVVTAGPDAGTMVPLRRGRLSVGRDPSCDVVLRDPRLSRRHCTLTVSPSGVQVDDTASTNGTGAPGTTATTVALGEEWAVGSGRLRVRAASPGHAARLAVTDRADGTREVRPPPRACPPEHAPELRLPPPVRDRRAGAFPLLAVALPAVAAGGLAWFTGSMVYLFLAALGPLLVAGSWWTSRRDARRDGRLGRREHARASAEVRSRAAVAADGLARARAVAMPTATALLDQAAHVQGHLWERHHTDPDALRLRLGRTAATDPGDATAGTVLLPRVRVVDHDGRTEAVRTAQDLLAADLRDGALGVVEPTADPSCARFLVAQLVALLPPSSLTVVPVLGERSRDAWRWLGLLPHLLGAADAAPGSPPTTAAHQVLGLIASRSARPADGPGRTPPPPSVLVVVDDPDGEVGDADLQRLAAGRDCGVHLLVVARDAARLPRGCALVLAPAGPDGVDGLLTRVSDGATGAVVLDRVRASWAERLSRALAPLRPAAAGTADAVPATVPLGDLIDLAPVETARRWARPPAGLPVPLGVGPRGPVVVDLVTAGPHALVAGTTGAGKSELLRSWLLAMAATQPPDRLALLLVDYKGGATFDDLVRLPHCVGLLTDLDGGATGRVLHSLRAEVRRREQVLAAAGARDLAGYLASDRPGPAPVPRLLVVVDEFRVLADEAPDVLGQFVRLAATGRSLGIHLVLATQRPGGVVSTDIRANAGLRIALRVQDAAESRDVVDRPDAAHLPPATPGRAVVVGAGVDATLQTAWTGCSPHDPTVTVLPVAGDGWWQAAPDRPQPTGPAGRRGAGPGTPADPGEAGAAGARRLVDAVVEAARRTGAAAARAPWLPPLPAHVAAADHPVGGTVPASGDSLVLGVADLPWAQARAPLVWRPASGGPLLVLGAARSGRSSTLVAAAGAAARAGVSVVRLSGTSGQEDHVVDVLTAVLAPPPVDGTGPGDSPEPGHHTPVGTCRVLVLVDDVDELLDPGADPAAADLLLRLARSGHRDGVGVVLAGGRVLAASRLAGTARARLVHRCVDRGDAALAGVPRAAAMLPPVPGRCHAVGLDDLTTGPAPLRPAGAGTTPAQSPGVPAAPEAEAVECQVFAPDGPVPQAHRPRPPVWVPRPLPTRLRLEDLPAPGRGSLPLGATTGGQPWRLDVATGGLFVVAGPPGSGRTTVLRAVAAQSRQAGLRVTDRWPDPRDPEDEVPRGPGLVLLDDADLLGGVEHAALERLLAAGPVVGPSPVGGVPTVVLVAATSWFADGFRGLPALARHTGRGLVLAPGRTDLRDVLGLRGGPSQLVHHPGRGLVVDRGQVRRVQVAVPSPTAAAAAAAGVLPSPRPASSVTPGEQRGTG